MKNGMVYYKYDMPNAVIYVILFKIIKVLGKLRIFNSLYL